MKSWSLKTIELYSKVVYVKEVYFRDKRKIFSKIQIRRISSDEFTLKCQRYENQSKIKLKFYINDLLDDEIISCCAYGFIHRNRPKHLFHIEEIIAAKPCYE